MIRKKTQKILGQTKGFYNEIALDFSDTRGHWWRGFGDFAKYVKPGNRVLDIGCGNGRMAEIFADSKVEYLGIDNSEELIKIARERFKDKPWVKFEVGDINNLQFKNNSYDLVLLIAVLHHLPSRQLRWRALKNIHDILQPGGRLVMVNWNLWQVFGWKKRFRYYPYLFNWLEKIRWGAWAMSDAFVPWKSGGRDTKRYIHSFTKGETRRLLRRAGFIIEELEFKAKSEGKKGIMYGDNLLAIAVKNGRM
ncbi:MAG: methyltransferase domain-containing protein [Patescibacteria group bacterium]|jgi:SAM-dependent methyltransferase